MSDFETISYERALEILRGGASRPVTLVTPSVPGVSIQVSGPLVVQDGGEHFAFAVAATDQMSVSVLPFGHCTFQIPAGVDAPEALICAMPGPETGDEMMLWLLRFE